LKKAKTKSRIQLNNIYSDGKVITTPIEMVNIDEFGVCTSNYIEIKDEAILKVSYKELMDALVMEIAHKDCGIDREDIDMTLGELGIVSVYSSKYLDSMYEIATYKIILGLKVESTEYRNTENFICDYYGKQIEKIKAGETTYEKAGRSTCNKTMNLITTDLLEELVNENVAGIKLLAVYEDSFELIVKKDKDLIAKVSNIVNKNIIARVFGRKFEFAPDIEII